jgi:hypothetical protein
MKKQTFGQQVWLDLSVKDAEKIKDFYQSVLGWQVNAVDMTDNTGEKYQDYAMSVEDEQNAVAGVCHAKGTNATLPPVWIPYFSVANVDDAVTKIKAHGGQLLTEIKSMGNDRYAMVQDPAGAVFAIYGN